MMFISKRIFRPAIALAVTLLAVTTFASAATISKTSSSKTTATTLSGVKWHPGHYLLTYITTTDAEMPNMIATLPQYFRGIQRRYTWQSVEPTLGQYNFTSIKTDLANLAKVNKKLVVQITVKSNTVNQSAPIVPSYLLSSSYDGGVYITQNGTNASLWSTAVQDRLIALFQALGSKIDLDTNLEAIVLHDETAPSVTNPTTWNPVYLDKYISGINRVAVAAKSAFPHTVVIEYINYPTAPLPSLLTSLKNAGIGVGGPDVLVEDSSLINGSYAYMKNLSNQVPIGMAVQYENYSARYHGGPYNPPGIHSLFQFSQQQLQANYIFWLRRTAESASASNGYHASNYYQDVLNYMSTINWTNNIAGGLNTTCPTMLVTCVH